MPPRENTYVTLWHAANAGDVEYMRKRMSKAFTPEAKDTDSDENSFDPEVLETRLLRTALPKRLRILNYAPTLPNLRLANFPVAYETGSLRLVIESLSERAFAAHGYLTDLSLERRFAAIVLEVFGKDKVRKDADDVTSKLFGSDRTQTYACTSELRGKQVVGTIAFSDFATFSVEGYILEVPRGKPSKTLRIAMEALLESIDPSGNGR